MTVSQTGALRGQRLKHDLFENTCRVPKPVLNNKTAVWLAKPAMRKIVFAGKQKQLFEGVQVQEQSMLQVQSGTTRMGEHCDGESSGWIATLQCCSTADELQLAINPRDSQCDATIRCDRNAGHTITMRQRTEMCGSSLDILACICLSIFANPFIFCLWLRMATE